MVKKWQHLLYVGTFLHGQDSIKITAFILHLVTFALTRFCYGYIMTAFILHLVTFAWTQFCYSYIMTAFIVHWVTFALTGFSYGYIMTAFGSPLH